MTRKPNNGEPARSTVYVVGPDAAGSGGIAAVTRVLLSSDLADCYELRAISTMVPGKRRGRLRHFARSCAEVVAARPWRSRVLFHIQLSSHGSFVRKSLVLALVKTLGGTAVVQIHGSRFADFAKSSRMHRRAVRWMLSGADLRAVLSPAWIELLAGVLAEGETVVLPNPAATSSTSAEREASTIAFLGAIGDRKGAYDLIEAAGDLQRRGVRFELVIAGEGELTRAQEAIAGLPNPAAIRLLGWLPPTAACDLLGRSAVFCLPSHAEGVPLAMLEAMAAGCAVVVSPVGGIPDVITDGVNGLLVPPGRPDQLADALEALLMDTARRERLGTEARRLIERRYTVEAVSHRLAAIYASLGYPPVTGDGDA